MVQEQRRTNTLLKEHLIACIWVGIMVTLIFCAIIFDWRV
jgi:hypothetical protein